MGCNIRSEAATKEIVERFHKNGQLVGVWVAGDTIEGGADFWNGLLDLNIDMLCSNNPLEAL